MVAIFPSLTLINKIFSLCLHLSVSIAAVTNNIFSLIPFHTFFPLWPSRWHQEICIPILRVHNTGAMKVIHDTHTWEWHRKQASFDIYASMLYKALLAKHCSQISYISLVVLAIQLGLHTPLGKLERSGYFLIHPPLIPQRDSQINTFRKIKHSNQLNWKHWYICMIHVIIHFLDFSSVLDVLLPFCMRHLLLGKLVFVLFWVPSIFQ